MQPPKPEHPSPFGVVGMWVLMLPAEVVKHFRLEPNMAAEYGDKDCWVGRLWHFRKIRYMQYVKARKWSVALPFTRKVELAAKFATGTPEHELLTRIQKMIRGWFTRRCDKPLFLDELVGLNIRSILVHCHGSGGLTWANPRMMRIACGFGCVVFAPDDMATPEWRSRVLKPLRTISESCEYWNNSIFYSGKKEVLGESIEFNTKASEVLANPGYYKRLYEKVFQVRSAELHFLLRRMPAAASIIGITLQGTSEGAMTVRQRACDESHIERAQ